MERERAIEEVKRRWREILPSLTPKAKSRINGEDSYICPFCDHGKGGDGLTKNPKSKDGSGLHCFACGFSGSIIDLYMNMESCEFNEALTVLAGKLSIRMDEDDPERKQPRKNQKQDKTERNTQKNMSKATYTTTHTQPQEEAAAPAIDFTEFYLQAHKDIGKTEYHRGLSAETLEHFNIGYVEEFRQPLEVYLRSNNGLTKNGKPKTKETWKYCPVSPRLIIPLTKNTYTVRLARPKINEEETKIYPVYGSEERETIFNREALLNATQPIFIVEGEIDAMSIYEVGGESVAIGGIDKAGAFVEYVKTVSATQTITEQPFIIALDNETDEKKKENVARAVRELRDGLRTLGLTVFEYDPCDGIHDANDALTADRMSFEARIKHIKEQVEEEQEKALEAEREELRRESAAGMLSDFQKMVRASKTAPCYPTGFKQIDNILDGGLYAGLYIVGAISSLGKTTFCLQIADQIAAAGHDVLFFSLEMSKYELMAKSISRMTVLQDLNEKGTTSRAKTTRGILTGAKYDKYTEDEKKLIGMAQINYWSYAKHIYITEGIGDVGINEIRERVLKHIRIMRKAPVVIIDYLQILAPADVRATDKQNTDRAVLELKRLSRDYNIPVIGISSFNRDNYNAPVNLASFKESGAIEYSSDVLIGLQYDGMDYKEGEADKTREKRIRKIRKKAIEDAKKGRAVKVQAHVLKNRNGGKDDALFDFYPMFNLFTETKMGQDELEAFEDLEDGEDWETLGE